MLCRNSYFLNLLLYYVGACFILLMFPRILPLNMISLMMALRLQRVMNLYMNKYIIDVYVGNVVVCHWALLPWYCIVCNEYI
jgi:hypothetical protein